MELIKQAITHVKEFLPDVDRVVIWEDGRWSFLNDNHDVIPFGNLPIDIGLLEDMVDSIPCEYLPFAYQLH